MHMTILLAYSGFVIPCMQSGGGGMVILGHVYLLGHRVDNTTSVERLNVTSGLKKLLRKAYHVLKEPTNILNDTQ